MTELGLWAPISRPMRKVEIMLLKFFLVEEEHEHLELFQVFCFIFKIHVDLVAFYPTVYV